MLLSEIVSKADIRYEITDDVEVKGLSYDSRKIEEGFVFFAIPGFKEDGSKYIQAAINKKAIAIICDKRVSIPELKIQPAIIPVSDVRLVMAKVACIFF
jgi:UDP-N-acetylmuramyl tripeptide synthase